MKAILLTFLTIISTNLIFAQQPGVRRSVNFRSIGKDSINLHFDENYFLIEDTCSSIVRYGHFDFKKRQFFGEFRDLNKMDPLIILAEGRYVDGKLNGPFSLKYLNGKPQAVGNFKDGSFDGRWELFYDDGKPRLNFTASGNTIMIEDAWDASGAAVVIKGEGKFRAELEGIYWEGKLVNGVPDGTWRCRRTTDRTNTILSSEVFKNGNFVKGSGPLGAYSDASRIVLVSPQIVPIGNASAMRISTTACDPSLSNKQYISAVYKHGWISFNEEVKRLVAPLFAKLDLKMYSGKALVIEGVVSEKGNITGLKPKGSFDSDISFGVSRELTRLPFLEPALINNVAVKQPITFTFSFTEGFYRFQYKLSPLISKQLQQTQ
ncbi:MAG TPA: hypothetical protein VGE26_03730 [Sphingobacteriaceae bacterium]